MEPIPFLQLRTMTLKVCIYGKMPKVFICKKNKFDKKI